MDIKTTAIILCAGVGSRMGVPAGTNKCALPIQGTSAIRHTASALLEAGAGEVAVVTGYAGESVLAALEGMAYRDKIIVVNNPSYAWHGCNYSLACAMESDCVIHAGKVVIAEGDSLLHRESIQKLVRTETEAASLIRDASYVDYSKSVMAVGSWGKISRFEYDTAHRGQAPALGEGEAVIGESMQLWSFAGAALKRLKSLLSEYREMADKSTTAFTHSGVYSINQLSIELEPVVSDHQAQWINLNTQSDLRKAGEIKWIIK